MVRMVMAEKMMNIIRYTAYLPLFDIYVLQPFLFQNVFYYPQANLEYNPQPQQTGKITD